MKQIILFWFVFLFFVLKTLHSIRIFRMTLKIFMSFHHNNNDYYTFLTYVIRWLWYVFVYIKINKLICVCVFYIKWKFIPIIIKSTHFFALCTKHTFIHTRTWYTRNPFTQFIQKNLAAANQFNEIKTKHHITLHR